MRDSRRVALGVLAVMVLGTMRIADARNLDGFARCLARERATFYGASWCPQCAAQRVPFGRSFHLVPYVECSVDGTQAIRPECAGVSGFPTWTFRDGSSVSGRQSLDQLASETGCSLDDRGRDEPVFIDVPSGGGAVRSPADSGVEIIEIP